MLFARSCLIAGALISLGGLLQAQEARLSGAVTDPTGAVLPGVIITATQTQQNISASTKSDAAGLYRFPRLSPGAYEVKAEFNGFKTFVQSGLALTTNGDALLNFTMEVGSLSEAISVTAQASRVSTESATMQQLIDDRRIVCLHRHTPEGSGNLHVIVAIPLV